MPDERAEARKRLGGYELISLLGRGGMGAVYKARQASLDRLVALKVLPPSLARNRDFIARFLREARAAGKLNHPKIVTGIDVGEADGFFYFAMEYVDGESLGRRLSREGRLAPRDAAAVVRQVAEGLMHAHQHGLIHRDVKPDNVLIDSRGTAKLCDLGLARGAGTDDSSLTQTGTALGTPNYISPEQARGEGDVDARTDIYSLGASLYHLITGTPPYEGKTSAVVLSRHLRDPVPQLARAVPEAGAGVSAIVSRCMQKSPGDRYPSMAELIEDLDLFLAGKSPRALLYGGGAGAMARPRPTGATHATAPLAPVGRRYRVATGAQTSFMAPAASRPWALVAAGTVLMVIFAAGAWAFTRPDGQRDRPRRDVPDVPDVPERPPEKPPGATDAELAVAAAREFWQNNPGRFDAALAEARKASTAAKGTRWWIDADRLVQEIGGRRDAAAEEAAGKLREAAAARIAAGDFDAALAIWAAPPTELRSALRDRAGRARDEVKRAAETRLQEIIDRAAAQLAAANPEGGLKELSAAAGLKYAAWNDRLSALRSSLEKARTDAAERDRLAALAAAQARLGERLAEFEKAAAAGEFGAALAATDAAAADPELKPLAAELTALAELAAGLRKATAARRAVLEEMKREGPQSFTTATGWVNGSITAIRDDAITVTWVSKVGTVERERSTDLRIADLTGKVAERLAGAFRPASPAEHLARAIQACAAGDAASMEAEMKAARAHALQPRWQARLDVMLLGAADAAAKEAWEKLAASPEAAPAFALNEKSAGALLEALDGYEKVHGGTKFAASVAGKLAELRERARSALGAWVSVPATALQVLVKGGAACTIDENAGVLRITSPQAGKAMIPLVANSADFNMKFQYRGPGMEMFLRRDGGRWLGCALALLTQETTRVRYYPAEDKGRSARDITASGARLSGSTWHAVETAARGSSLLIRVDGRVIAQATDLPAVTRGDSYALVWDTGAGAVELRGLEISVAEKDTATHAEGGIVGGIVTARERDGAWVEVEADGAGAPQRYVPFPMGGGNNPMTVEALKKVFSANRVTVIWKPLGGERRIAAIWTHVPAQQSGAVTGTVVKVVSLADGRWMQFDLKPEGAGPIERYSPRWQNGPDAGITAAIRELREGQRVRVEWQYETRKRALKIQQVQ